MDRTIPVSEAVIRQAVDMLYGLISLCELQNWEVTDECRQSLADLRSALRQDVQQPVAWQYRWTNPGEQEHLHSGDTDWKWVEHPHWQPLESKLAELRAYRYKDKPCYEVRALGVIAAPQRQEWE